MPLSEWKRAKGHLAEVAKLSEIGSSADDIQSYLQDVYDNWSPAPTFILLVGDQDKLPCHLIESPFFGTFPSDLPYSCLDGGDYLPDVTLGRLSVETGAECTAVVNKILKYDREPDTGSWYEDVLLAGYFQDNGDNGIADRWFMETIIHIKDFLESEHIMIIAKFAVFFFNSC